MKKKIFALCLLIVVSSVLFCGCNFMSDETAQLLSSLQKIKYTQTTTTIETKLDGQKLTSVFVAEKTDDKTTKVNYIVEQLSLFDENSTVAVSEVTTYTGEFYVSGGSISNHTGENKIADIEGSYSQTLGSGMTFNKDYFGKTVITNLENSTQIVAEVKNAALFLGQSSFDGHNMTATIVVVDEALSSIVLDYVDDSDAVVKITYKFTK